VTHMGYDKKRASGVLKWITLDRAGSAVWGESVGMEAIRDMLRGLQKHG
jgi:3-dehydroquinate synthetase